jgi:hypothetical protein
MLLSTIMYSSAAAFNLVFLPFTETGASSVPDPEEAKKKAAEMASAAGDKVNAFEADAMKVRQYTAVDLRMDRETYVHLENPRPRALRCSGDPCAHVKVQLMGDNQV